MKLVENISTVKEKIENACILCGRKNDIKIIGVTKTRSPEEINELLIHGIDTIGENKVQELVDKFDGLDKRFDIQIIGQLQTNKVKFLTDKITCIQSLDRVSLAKEIEKQYNKINKSVDALIQINLTNDETRGGVAIDGAYALCEEISNVSSINLKGIMTVAPLGLSEYELRLNFNKVYNLFNVLKNSFPYMDRLSMGMSNDYEQAILEGATEVRLGSALFGERIYKI